MDKERSGETMKLGAFFHPTGNHVAAWLHPDAQIDAGSNFRHYAEITQTAERGKFDLMFVADAVATRDGKLEALSRWPQYMAYFDPLTLLPALAAVTTHIGLCATATTSYNEPYHIARKFASLDHISGGRAGWNRFGGLVVRRSGDSLGGGGWRNRCRDEPVRWTPIVRQPEPVVKV